MKDNGRRELPALREDVNAIGVRSLLIDTDLALTFVYVAGTTASMELRNRNISSARKICNAVQNGRPKYVLSEAKTVNLNSKLDELRVRLVLLGQDC